MEMQQERMLCKALESKITTAWQAARIIEDGMVVATSGFTPVGYPKEIPKALAERARNGEKIGITLITGASVGPEIDTELTEMGVIKRRYPYQTNSELRNAINKGEIQYADMHLSHVPVWMKLGYFGHINLAVIEAVAIDEHGRIFPSTSVGISNTAVQTADKVIIEVNHAQPMELRGLCDIYNVAKPPNTQPIPLTHPEQRIGVPYITCDFKKIAAIVPTNTPDGLITMAPIDEISEKMAQNLIRFLENQVKAKKLPPNLFPLQSGVGSVANAVLGGLVYSDFENLTIYSEVLQDSVLDLLDTGKLNFASATSLTISSQRLPAFYKNLHRYRDKIVLRPQELSNHPEIIRRLGVIAMNTAIEVDIYGNVNSTHIGGSRLMNGIGGSGDFARNASISIFTTASCAQNGKISSIVSAVSHVDHNEHSVQVIVTEQGVADIRGLSPIERAEVIIENCAHPDFRPMLRSYLFQAKNNSKYQHIPLYKS